MIPRVLAGIPGIADAYIYGSWAARRDGEPGSAPGDIDLLVVGNPQRSDVYDAAQHAGAVLAREVNVRIVSASAWEAGEDLFIQTVKERPLVRLDLEKNAG